MRIGFDIDDCITKTAQTFCQYYNTLFKNHLEFELLTSPTAKFEDTRLVTIEQVSKVKKKYYDSRLVSLQNETK